MIDIELQGKAAIDWWYKEKDPAKLIQYLNPPNILYSERKLRLFCVACCRLHDKSNYHKEIWNGLERAENIAEYGFPSRILYEDTLDELRAAREDIKNPNLFRVNYAATLCYLENVDPIEVAYNTSSRPNSHKYGITRTRGEQCDLLRDIIGNPIDIIDIDTSWLTPEVNNLVKCAFFDRLPDYTLNPEILGILSDALEESGCSNLSILEHLRDDNKPHVRGCWVVDLLLGKK